MPPSTRPTRRGAKAVPPVTETKAVEKTPPAKKPEPATEVKGSSDERPKIYYEKSVTKNLGDYNSAKITVGVSLSVDPTAEELAAIDRTIVVANSILDAEIEKQLTSITEA